MVVSDVAFDYFLAVEEFKWERLTLPMNKIVALSLVKGDIVQMAGGELICFDYKKYTESDENGFEVVELFFTVV